MANETKVGLLAGLAFIVCFAVILTQRGRPQAGAESVTTLVDGVVGGRGVSPLSPSAPRREAPAESKPAANGRPHVPGGSSPHGSSLQAPPTRNVGGSSGLIASTGTTPGTAATMPEQGPLVSTQALERVSTWTDPPTSTVRHASLPTPSPPGTRSISVTVPAHAGRTDQPIVPSAVDAPIRSGIATEQGGLTVPASSHEAARTQTSHAALQAPELRADPASDRPGRHLVRAGDTLSRIATTYYRNKSGVVIQAIVSANTAVLSDPDVLPLDAVLTLPVVKGIGGPSVSSAQPTTERPGQRRSEPATAEDGTAFRWYQVRKHDCYMSIARDQLGDERRWREIHESNKDRFPQPDNIREGVRIKLPATSALARETRRS